MLAASPASPVWQVEPLALSAADGMNACIFAYGQTGSGKTHTMIGDAKGGEMAGVSYRTMNKLFQVLELRRRQQVCGVLCVYRPGEAFIKVLQ